jgi:hypothetical protein
MQTKQTINIVSRRTPNKKITNRMPISSRALTQYARALQNPFDPKVIGVRLPNEFATQTVPFHVCGFAAVGCSSGTGSGYMFTASPLVACYDFAGSMANIDMDSYTAAPTVYSALSEASLLTAYDSYRVVSVGYKIRNLLPSTATPVTVQMTVLPAVSHGVSPQILTVAGAGVIAGTSELATAVTGVVSSTVSRFGGAITTTPNFQRFTSQDVISNAVIVALRPTDPRAFEFRNTYNSAALGNILATTYVSDSVVENTDGSVGNSYASNPDTYTPAGFSVLCLDLINGGYTETNNPAVLEIEFIYHMEGIPKPVATSSSTGSSTLNSMSSDATRSGWSGIATHLADIAWANKQDVFSVTSAAVGTLFKKATASSTILATQF